MSIESEVKRLLSLRESVVASAVALAPYAEWVDEATRDVQSILGQSARISVVLGLLELVRESLGTLEQVVVQASTAIATAASHHGGPAATGPAAGTRQELAPTAQASDDDGLRRATFGHSDSTNYKKTFFAAHPDLKGKVWVHHAVEQQAMERFPEAGLTSEEIHSLENLRGIPTGETNNRIHLSAIRKEWNKFYRANKNKKVTKEKLLDWATSVDEKHGTEFRPPVR
ncbi:hypothetical protein JOD54_002136 [Actinokineospora baliensis]|uniref:hypothetical protein n=1 Tax=Actinokineospora baliensis TaxID=547056 RepID=UPI00195BA838|nr:hypothetical protein [Actinokineospora baliensis]MBM7771932.1 hypothetical protein [Actinokineospora baliensis]